MSTPGAQEDWKIEATRESQHILGYCRVSPVPPPAELNGRVLLAQGIPDSAFVSPPPVWLPSQGACQPHALLWTPGELLGDGGYWPLWALY